MEYSKRGKNGTGPVTCVPSSPDYSPRVNGKALRKRLFVYERDGYRCKLFCGRTLTLETATLDHVIPRSRGGSGAINNLVTACASCNRRKDDKLMRDHGYEWNHWSMEWEKRGNT